MHKYKIRYIDTHGRTVTESIYAVNAEAAKNKLIMAAEVLKISDKGMILCAPLTIQRLFHMNRLSPRELADILRNISYTRQSGLTIVDSLNVLSSTGSIKQVMLCHSLVKSLKEGASLADAFARETDRLPLDVSGVIAASSKADTLNTVLLALADQLESNVNIMNKVRSAMLYPCMVLVIAVMVAWFLFVNIIPQVATVIQSIGHNALPDSTIAILGLSSFLQEYGLAVVLIAFAIIILLITLFRKCVPRFKDKLKLNVPVIGDILRDNEMVRFLNHFAFLLRAGFTTSDALDAAIHVTDNKFISEHLCRSLVAIKEGYQLTAALAVSNVFTQLELQMLGVGEASGNIAEVCVTLARQLHEQSNRRLHDMIRLVEPAIMIIVGGLVGVIMVAIYQPLFELMSIV